MYNNNVSQTHPETYGALPPQEDKAGTYFPPSLISALETASQGVIAKAFTAHMAAPADFALLTTPMLETPKITLEESKTLIIEALNNFDRSLGMMAEEILSDPARMNITEQDGRMMQCRPANSEIPGMENDKPFAIIDFDYNNTIGSVIYLAHELGHAIADDLQRDAGNSYKANPAHMAETQAYLIQNIIYDYLKAHPDKNIAAAAESYFTGDMGRHMYDLPLSLAAMDALQTAQAGQPVNAAQIFETRFGQGWEKFIANYPNASRVFDAVSVLKISPNDAPNEASLKLLGREFERLHERPTSMLAAAGIAHMLQTQSDDQKHDVAQLLLGGKGPAGFADIMDKTGLNGAQKLADFAAKTMEKVTHHLISESAPAMTRQHAPALRSQWLKPTV